MAIEIDPIACHSTLRYRFAGRITADDLAQLADWETAAFAALTGSVWIIADWTDLYSVPPDLFPRLQQLRLAQDARVGEIIVVGANAYLRALAISLGTATGNNRFAFCDTLSDALRRLGLDAAQSGG